LKTKNSPGYGDDDYNVIPVKKFPYLTLAEAAKKLRIRKQRMSRLLRILQIPVHKIGTLVLLDGEAIERLQEAVKNNEVKRGRKPNAA
jgi:excisionase family DNA binding protein